MSRITLKTIMEKEIHRLNKRIDRKILRGRSYFKDAQRHQALMVKYRRIESSRERNISIGSLLTT